MNTLDIMLPIPTRDRPRKKWNKNNTRLKSTLKSTCSLGRRISNQLANQRSHPHHLAIPTNAEEARPRHLGHMHDGARGVAVQVAFHFTKQRLETGFSLYGFKG